MDYLSGYNCYLISKTQIGDVKAFNKRVLYDIKVQNGNEETYDVFISNSALSDIKIFSNVEFVEFVWAYIDFHYEKKENNKWLISTDKALDSFIMMYSDNTVKRINFEKCNIEKI